MATEEQEEKEAKRRARTEAAAQAQAAKANASAAPADPKKAAVEAAVQRAQAKRQTMETSAPDIQVGSGSGSSANASNIRDDSAPNLEALKVQVDKAEEKLAMMQGMLEEAQAESPLDDNKIAKLTRAVEKNQDRVSAAERAFTAAGGVL